MKLDCGMEIYVKIVDTTFVMVKIANWFLVIENTWNLSWAEGGKTEPYVLRMKDKQTNTSTQCVLHSYASIQSAFAA